MVSLIPVLLRLPTEPLWQDGVEYSNIDSIPSFNNAAMKMLFLDAARPSCSKIGGPQYKHRGLLHKQRQKRVEKNPWWQPPTGGMQSGLVLEQLMREAKAGVSIATGDCIHRMNCVYVTTNTSSCVDVTFAIQSASWPPYN